jgi:hypothetical protein
MPTTIASGTDVDASDKEKGRKNKKKKKTKKVKEKEILDKCRVQEAPVKYVVSTGDKSVEETKKILWSQVVSKNKAPKIKEIVTLKGGDLLITPADENTKEAIVSIAKEEFGIKETGSLLPKVIIYDVDRDITPEELPRRIIEQNPELGITEEELSKLTPKFRTGPRDMPNVHWVLEAQPEVFRKIVDRRIYLSFSVCRVTEYLNISICHKCQKFGHIADKCRSTKEICGYCAQEGHRRELCPNKDKDPKCANCSQPFQSTHQGCTYKASRVRMMVRKTKY